MVNNELYKSIRTLAFPIVSGLSAFKTLGLIVYAGITGILTLIIPPSILQYKLPSKIRKVCLPILYISVIIIQYGAMIITANTFSISLADNTSYIYSREYNNLSYFNIVHPHSVKGIIGYPLSKISKNVDTGLAFTEIIDPKVFYIYGFIFIISVLSIVLRSVSFVRSKRNSLEKIILIIGGYVLCTSLFDGGVLGPVSIVWILIFLWPKLLDGAKLLYLFFFSVIVHLVLGSNIIYWRNVRIPGSQFFHSATIGIGALLILLCGVILIKYKNEHTYIKVLLSLLMVFSMYNYYSYTRPYEFGNLNLHSRTVNKDDHIYLTTNSRTKIKKTDTLDIDVICRQGILKTYQISTENTTSTSDIASNIGIKTQFNSFTTDTSQTTSPTTLYIVHVKHPTISHIKDLEGKTIRGDCYTTEITDVHEKVDKKSSYFFMKITAQPYIRNSVLTAYSFLTDPEGANLDSGIFTILN